MAVTLYLLNDAASDPGTAKQIVDTAQTGNNTLTYVVLDDGLVVHQAWVTEGYGAKEIVAGSWSVRLRMRLDPAEDTSPGETIAQVKLYKRDGTSNSLLATSSEMAIDSATYGDITFNLGSLAAQSLDSNDDLYIELLLDDQPFGDSNVQVNVESSTSQCILTHPDFAAAIEQEGYRFRADNGSESSAGWLANQDTALTYEKEVNVRLRVLLDSPADPASTAYELQYKKGAGDWNKVLTAQPSPPTPAFRSAGTSAQGTKNITPGAPAGAAEGDILICVIGRGTSGETVSMSGDWTSIVDTGHVAIFWCRRGASNPSFTITHSSGGNISASVAAFSGCKDTGSPFNVVGTPNTASNSTITHLGITTTADDCLRLMMGGLGDNNLVGDIADWTEAFDASGSSGAPDSAHYMTYRDALDDTGTYGNVTLSQGTTDNYTSVMVALEGNAGTNQEILMSASANITASGENTTAQLTPPSGKTTGDFSAGRIQDDENPTDAVDIGANDYTELEWCLIATTYAATDDVYTFRVIKDGGALLDTYTVTPQWTIGTSASEAESTTAGQILTESLSRSTTAGQIDSISFYTFDTSAGQIFLESHSRATTAGQIVLETADQFSVTAGQITIRTRTNKVILVSPLSGFEATPVTFVWECPDNVDNKAVQFHIQVDNNSDFSSPLHEKKSSVDSGFEYWDGDSWETVPVTGVPAAYYGNDVRIQLPFSVNEVVYWRVRGGAS